MMKVPVGLLAFSLALAGLAPVLAQTTAGVEGPDPCAVAARLDAALFLDISATASPIPTRPGTADLVFEGRLRDFEAAGVDPRDYEVFVTYPDASGQYWIAGTVRFDAGGRPRSDVTVGAANFTGLYRMQLINNRSRCGGGQVIDMRLVRGRVRADAPVVDREGITLAATGLFGQ